MTCFWIVRSMNHWDFQVHLDIHIYIYIYICMIFSVILTKDYCDFHKKWIPPFFFKRGSINLEVFDGCICFSYIWEELFYPHSVTGIEWPWFTKERRCRVYTFPADARRSLSQGTGRFGGIFRSFLDGASHRSFASNRPPSKSLRFIIFH